MNHPTGSLPSKPYKVFVSSTFLDNKERRRLVADAITQAGMVWHGMELFTAESRPAAEVCARYAREADLLVGIIAWRYGSIPPGAEKSYTELEYDAARERLMFVLDTKLPVNPETDFDPGEDRWDKQKKLDAFKARINKDQMPASFTATTLQTKVLSSLHNWRRDKEATDQPTDPETDKAEQPRTATW